MRWLRILRPRFTVLLFLWMLPVLMYLVVGAIAIYQADWFFHIVWLLPAMWFVAWIVGKLWSPTRHHRTPEGKPLRAPAFWTPRDTGAIAVVEQFRAEVADAADQSITDYGRYLLDAQVLAERLAKYYHADQSESLLHPLTLVEILSVIHLAVEDLEQWTIAHVPGSNLATIGQIEQVPSIIGALDAAQKVIYVASAILNPSKLLAYPLWRKSGRISVELQKEVTRAFYQRFLRQLGYYLIEMYSGRLRGGSAQYRTQFAPMALAAHELGGNLEELDKLSMVPTTIAVMGQVKAGKSSLINALLGSQVSPTSVLPETRAVHRFEYSLPGFKNAITLLDTPGYDEANVSRQQLSEIRTAAESADLILLVMAANSPARESDRQLLRELTKLYTEKKTLKPPAVIAVLTHIDLLRPVREWSPPYDWRNPHELKEESISAAVKYVDELFGSSIASYACVYTGESHEQDPGVIEEVVPVLVEQLDQSHSAAILKAFYKRLSDQRFKHLTSQVIGLLKTVTRG